MTKEYRPSIYDEWDLAYLGRRRRLPQQLHLPGLESLFSYHTTIENLVTEEKIIIPESQMFLPY